jgi:hypothetical protein
MGTKRGINMELLSHTQLEVIESNGEALGISGSDMIGFLIDDMFGGLSVGDTAADSFQSIYEHIDTLEWIVRDGLE